MLKEKRDVSTEQRIKEAARTVFIMKGFDGARMHHIAEEAGINKALLHYYFRSKEKLFEEIFHDVLIQLVSRIGEIITSELPLKKKIEDFVESYIEFLVRHPFLPPFVIQELNRQPERILEYLKGLGNFPEILNNQINKEVSSGNIRPVMPEHLMTNIISMTLFPFIARPILTHFFFRGREEDYGGFIMERKREIIDFVFNAIQPTNNETV